MTNVHSVVCSYASPDNKWQTENMPRWTVLVEFDVEIDICIQFGVRTAVKKQKLAVTKNEKLIRNNILLASFFYADSFVSDATAFKAKTNIWIKKVLYDQLNRKDRVCERYPIIQSKTRMVSRKSKNSQ